MKVKYLGTNTALRTNGKIYDVIRKYEYQGATWITIKGDMGDAFDSNLSNNFVVWPEDPIEEKKREISDAQNVVTEAQKALDVLEKELADLKAPKAGERFSTNGELYVLAEIEGKFGLIKYERKNGSPVGYVYSRKLHDTPEQAFVGHFKFFTKIS